MKFASLLRRLAPMAAACAAALLLAPAAAAASGRVMTENGGFVAVMDGATGGLLCRTDVPVALLSQRDRLLLEAGIPLETQADFTRAMEDFCS